MSEFLFEEIVQRENGFLRGPFGGALKKEIFVRKGPNTYKVYEQGVVLNKNPEIGEYYITEEYYDSSMSRFNAIPGDILVSCSGVNYGAIYQLPPNSERGVINQALLRIRLNNNLIDDKFFVYYFESLIARRITGGTGDSTIPNFPPMSVIRKIPVEIPDILTQRKIAAVLFALDDKIELNNKINVQLEQMAKTLYDYWFVQFDFPNAKGKPYKTSGGKMVYNDVLKREIPQGWEVSTFCDWIAETKAGDWGKDNKEGNYTERVICIRGADINGINGKGEVKPPERFILKTNTSKALLPNDFIVEISGGSPTQSTGRLALLSNNTFERFNAPIICSNFCKAISLKNEKYVFNFQQEWQRLYDANVLFGFEGKTSGIKNFLFDSFVNSYYVAVPKKEVVEKFYEFAQSVEIKKQNNLLQNQQIAAIRDWLLPMLMNGQAKVSGNHSQQKELLNLAAGPVLEYNERTQLNIPNSKKGFAKQVLAGKIISLFKDDPHFTDIKFQKIQFLAEHMIQADLNLNYYYQSAGPYDNIFMHTIYNALKKYKWYDYKNRKFTALEKQIKIDEYYHAYFGAAIDQLDKLFRLLEKVTEATAEIIATIYAVWNNFIIEKKPFTDKELIEGFYSWSQRKQQYTKPEIFKGIQWLRVNNLAPTGFGKLIKKAKGKK